MKTFEQLEGELRDLEEKRRKLKLELIDLNGSIEATKRGVSLLKFTTKELPDDN